jgi:hypothetical protein
MARRAAVAVALAMLVMPAGASANHIQPAVSIHLTDLGVQKDFSHHVRVEWQGGCGPNAPNALVNSDKANVKLMLVPARAGKHPVAASTLPIETANDNWEFDVDPGRRLFARVTLVCQEDMPGATPEDDPVTESATATADTPEQVYVPPRLLGYHLSRASYCGNTTARQRATGMGAADFQTLNWKLSFGTTSMLQHPSVTGILEEVRLRASGKGMRVRVGPASGPLRKYQEFQATIFSPRSGKVKIWAEIGGVRTNSLTVPIFGKPCVLHPFQYYGAVVMRGANPFIRD